jgi:multidrug transporter EmrE-like cation transporter
MNPWTFTQLAAATAIFLAAATSAKSWAVSPDFTKTLLTLALYTFGNLLMMRLVRALGMSTAFSISAVVQLIAINLVAIFAFGERLGRIETVGVALGVVSVALITLGPALTAR